MQLNRYDIECLEKVRLLIEKDLAVRHTVRQLAAVAGMGTTKFQAAFKTYTGLPVSEFLQQQRMQLAWLLVKENYHSIKTVALLCGYGHSSNFNTAFKRSFGLSAKELRCRLSPEAVTII